MTRTPDLLITNQLHYLLCYTSKSFYGVVYYISFSSDCQVSSSSILIETTLYTRAVEVYNNVVEIIKGAENRE